MAQIQPITGPAPTQVTNTAGNSLLEVWNSTQCIMVGAGWSIAISFRLVLETSTGRSHRPFKYGIQAAWQLPGTVPVGAFANNATYPTLGQSWVLTAAQQFSTQQLTTDSQTTSKQDTQSSLGYDINTGSNSAIRDQNTTFTPYTAVNLDNYGNVGDGVFTTIIKETGKLPLSALLQENKYGKQHSKGDNGSAYQRL